MFGRKGVTAAAPQRFAHEPRPAHVGPEGARAAEAGATIARLSAAAGMDLEFGRAFIFAPSHWHLPEVGPMLRAAGMEPNHRSNTMQLLRSPASVAKLKALAPDAPIRAALLASGFGVMLFDPDAENGCSDALAKMQADTLRGLAARYSGEARTYAVFDFHRWSGDVLKGLVTL